MEDGDERLAALHEGDLDRHADLDLLGLAVDDVRHQAQAGLLGELDEQPGLRLMTNIVDCPTDHVEIGMPDEVAFVERGEAFIPVFHKVAA